MRGLIESRGLDDFVVDSAGTGDWHIGKPADPRAIVAASERGVKIDSRARQVATTDFEEFDLILAMDQSNHATLLSMEGADPARIRLFREMAGEGTIDVPDPYFGDEDGFDQVLDILERGCTAVLDELEK